MKALKEKDWMEELKKEAVEELGNYPRTDAKQQMKRLAKTAAGRYVEPRDPIFWPAGLLANALMNCVLALPEGDRERHELVTAVGRHFDGWIKKGCKLYFPDDMLSGVALTDLYEVTQEERYKEALGRMRDYLYQHPVDGGGSFPYRSAQGNGHIYADGAGMTAAFLCKYGAAFGEAKAVDLGVTQLVNFLQYGMDEKTGLPYHGYEYESKVKYGIIGWGRAVGWLMMGLADSLSCLDKGHPQYDFLKQSFRRMVDKVEGYQLPGGLYAWQLEAREGPADTSASGMILYAVARGLKSGLLIDIHRSHMKRGGERLRLSVKDGKVHGCLAECLGFGQYPQEYGAYPWSLGPALSLFAVDRKPY